MAAFLIDSISLSISANTLLSSEEILSLEMVLYLGHQKL